jgi:hypothetical protein
MLVWLLDCWDYLCVISFHELYLSTRLGRTLVFLRHAKLAESRVNHGNWLTFCIEL